MITDRDLDCILAEGVLAHVNGSAFTQDEQTALRRRWNQLRGNDCAIGRGVHLSNYHAQLCIDALDALAACSGDGRAELYQNLSIQLKESTP